MTPDDQDPSHAALPPAKPNVADPAEIPLTEDDEEAESEVDEEAVAAVDGFLKMQKEIRSWGLWLLLFGALHFIGSGLLSAPWGVLLLVVGLSSFYFRQAAMFIIYAITLAWAAVSNLIGAQATWVVFGLFQVYLAVQVHRNFRRFSTIQANFRRLVAEDRITTAPAPDRAASVFPVTGCLLSAFSLLGVVGIIVTVFGAAIIKIDLPGGIDFAVGIVVNLAVLGLAIGLASIVAHYRHRALAVLGVIASVLVLLLWLAFTLL